MTLWLPGRLFYFLTVSVHLASTIWMWMYGQSEAEDNNYLHPITFLYQGKYDRPM